MISRFKRKISLADDQHIRKNYSKKTAKEIAKFLGRTENSIHHYVSRIGLKANRTKRTREEYLEVERIRGRQKREKLDSKNLCYRCFKRKRAKNRTVCTKCKINALILRDEAIKNGLCGRCKLNKLHSKKNCKQCLEKQRSRGYKLKEIVYSNYGGYKCNCCGETEKSFLSIDHINNDGYKLRKITNQGSGTALYAWLIRHSYPKDYQILCMNCQFGKKKFKICPHKFA